MYEMYRIAHKNMKLLRHVSFEIKRKEKKT